MTIKKIRNESTKDKRYSKKAYFTFEINKNKSSGIWNGIRSLVNLKSAKSSNIKLLDQNINLISDPKKIYNTFNDHFASIGSKIEQKIPHKPGNLKTFKLFFSVLLSELVNLCFEVVLFLTFLKLQRLNPPQKR